MHRPAVRSRDADTDPCCAQKKSKVKGSGRKDNAFVVDDDDSVSEAEEEEEEDGGRREYVVVSGGESEADDDDVPLGIAALEQIAAKRKVPNTDPTCCRCTCGVILGHSRGSRSRLTARCS